MPDYEEKINKIKSVLKGNPEGLTISKISEEVGINRNSVAKYLEILTISGKAERRNVGPAKVYSLSQNVPISAMLDYSTDCIIVLNSSLEVVEVNDRFLEVAEENRGEIVREKIEKLNLTPFQSVKEGESSCGVEKTVISEIEDALKNSKERKVDTSCVVGRKEHFFEATVIPTTFEDGEKGVTLILEDITERKRAREELKKHKEKLEELVKERTGELRESKEKLRRNKERLRTLIDSSDDSIYMVDKNCNYVLANDEIASRLDTNKEDIIGKNFQDFHKKEDYEKFKEKVEKVFETGEKTIQEHSWSDPERCFLRTFSPVKDSETGDVKNVAVISKDITSRKVS